MIHQAARLPRVGRTASGGELATFVDGPLAVELDRS